MKLYLSLLKKMEFKVFTNEQSWKLLCDAEGVENEYVSIKRILQCFRFFKSNKMKGDITFPFKSEKKLLKKWNKVQSHFKIIEAAGGVVKNDSEKILFILRLGKWDLPKGKIEKGEQIEQAAIREVEEECNIIPTLSNKIGDTWHTYEFKGQDVLKKTHWFSMYCSDEESEKIKPQLEEDIEETRWFTKQEIKEVVLPNTYQSIKEIYSKYL